jgi:hypothetical protein
LGALVGRRRRGAWVAGRRASGGKIGDRVVFGLLVRLCEEGGKNHGGELGRVAALCVTEFGSLQQLLAEGRHRAKSYAALKNVARSFYERGYAR